MAHSRLPAPQILADGVTVGGVTTAIGHLGGYDLTIATTVGDLALDVQSTILGHPATATLISWIVRSAELSQAGSETLVPGGLADHTARSRRLLEHYDRVRHAIAEITHAEVRINVDDEALGVTAVG